MDNNWQTMLAAESRQKIVRRIMDTLQRHMSVAGLDGMDELLKIAWRFEEKIFQAATDQQDYLRKISLKMLSLETKANGNPLSRPAAHQQDTAQALGNGLQLPNQTQQQQQQQLQQQAQSLQAKNLLANGLQQMPQQQQRQQQPQAQQPLQQQKRGVVDLMGQQQLLLQRRLQQQALQRMQQQQQLLQQQQQQQVLGLQQQGQSSNPLLSETNPLLQQQQQQQHQQQQKQLLHQQLLQQAKQHQKVQQQQQSQQLQQPHHLQQQQQQQHQQQPQQQTQQQLMQQAMPQPSLSQQPQLSAQQAPQQTSQQPMLGEPSQQQRSQQPGSLMQQQQQQREQPHALPEPSTASVDSSGHSRPGVVAVDQAEVVWDKLQQLNNRYLQDMNELYGMLSTRSNQPMPAEQLQKLKHYKDVLHRMIPYLRVPKERVPKEFNQDKVDAFEKQIISIMDTFKRRHQPQPPQPPGEPSVAEQPPSAAQAPVQDQPVPGQLAEQPNAPQLLAQVQAQQAQQQQQPQLGLQQAQGSIQEVQNHQQQQQILSQIQQEEFQRQLNTGAQAFGTLLPPSSHTPAASPQQNVPLLQNVGGATLQQNVASTQPNSALLPSNSADNLVQLAYMSLQPLDNGFGGGTLQPTGVNSVQPGGLNTQLQTGVNLLQPTGTNNSLQNQVKSSSLVRNQVTFNSVMQNQVSPMQQGGVPAQIAVSSPQQGGVNQLGGMTTQQQPGVSGLQQGRGSSLQQHALTALQQGGVSSHQNQNESRQRHLLKQQQEQQQQQLIQAQQAAQQRLIKDQELVQQQLQQQQLQQQQMLQQRQQLQMHHHQKNQTTQLHAAQYAQQAQHQHQQQISDDPQKDAIKVKQAVHQAFLAQAQMKQRQIKFQQLQQQQQQQQEQQQMLIVGSPKLASPPQVMQAPSPQAQQLSPQPDQSFVTQAATPPFMNPASTTPATSPSHEDIVDTKVFMPSITAIATPNTLQALQSVTTPPNMQTGIMATTAGMGGSPLLTDYSLSPAALPQDVIQEVSPESILLKKPKITDPPLEHLMKQVNSIPQKVLVGSIGDISATISCSDKVAASGPGSGSRAAVGEDLAAITRVSLQARAMGSQHTSKGQKKRRRFVESIALNVCSSNGRITNTCSRSSDIRASSMTHVKTPRIQVSASLDEEILNINSRLIDTVVEVNEEGTEEAATEGKGGVVVVCSYMGNAVSPNVPFLQRTDYYMVHTTPLYVVVPPTYPESSPVIWTEHTQKSTSHPLAIATREEFAAAARCFPKPVSLGDIARCWDECARTALTKMAILHGGGTFSSSMGVWETTRMLGKRV